MIRSVRQRTEGVRKRHTCNNNDGRGDLDIARQVKAETGVSDPIEKLRSEIAQMMKAWKEETYPVAWKFMERCASQIYTPGYLVNPWGRKRRFFANPDDPRPDMERQAQNFPVQSTVADTAMIAMSRVERFRKERCLSFAIVNQIHDAIMLEVPERELEASKVCLEEAMGTIDIPVGGTHNTLRLGVDLTVYTRWGVKAK